MQVVSPRDIEELLPADLDAIFPDSRVFGTPPPDDLKAGDVMVTRVGGSPLTHSTHEHDLSVDVWASRPAKAAALADRVCGVIASLPLRETLTEYKTARVMAPYYNPDPNRPNLPRYTFTATVTVRGDNIEF